MSLHRSADQFMVLYFCWGFTMIANIANRYPEESVGVTSKLHSRLLGIDRLTASRGKRVLQDASERLQVMHF